MYGQNTVMKQEKTDGSILQIQEIFRTIQGEGPLSGVPAIFIRLGGCNLKCHFCDTDFESHIRSLTLAKIQEEVFELLYTSGIRYVVLTGGEPLRQNVVPLIRLLNHMNLIVQIETAGTLWFPELSAVIPMGPHCHMWTDTNSIVCSPKTEKLNSEIIPYISAWKYIIRDGEVDEVDGLPIASTQMTGKVSRIARWYEQPQARSQVVYLQPCDEGDENLNFKNMDAAIRIAMRHGYRISLQTHKIMSLP